MKTKFNLLEALGSRREMVINKYNDLTAERFFDGVSLKGFMVEVMNGCVAARVTTENSLNRMLPIVMGEVYVNHSKVMATDKVTESLRKQYNGTAYMALV